MYEFTSACPYQDETMDAPCGRPITVRITRRDAHEWLDRVTGCPHVMTVTYEGRPPDVARAYEAIWDQYYAAWDAERDRAMENRIAAETSGEP